MTCSTRGVSTALYNVKYGPLPSVSNFDATSPKIPEVQNVQEEAEISEIHERFDSSAPTQALQTTFHAEARGRFWGNKKSI